MWDIICLNNAFTCNNQCPDLGDVAMTKTRSRVCALSFHREFTFVVQKYIFGTQINVHLEQKLFFIHFLLSCKSFELLFFCVCFQKGNIRYINKSELNLRYTHKFAVRAKAFLFTDSKHIFRLAVFFFCIHNLFGCSERHFGYTKKHDLSAGIFRFTNKYLGIQTNW